MKVMLLLSLTCLIILGACASPVETPRADVPRYTADQVIEVAAWSSSHREDCSFRAIYTGNGVWRVTRGCPESFTEWDFYEFNGQMVMKTMKVIEQPAPTSPSGKTLGETLRDYYNRKAREYSNEE